MQGGSAEREMLAGLPGGGVYDERKVEGKTDQEHQEKSRMRNTRRVYCRNSRGKNVMVKKNSTASGHLFCHVDSFPSFLPSSPSPAWSLVLVTQRRIPEARITRSGPWSILFPPSRFSTDVSFYFLGLHPAPTGLNPLGPGPTPTSSNVR